MKDDEKTLKLIQYLEGELSAEEEKYVQEMISKDDGWLLECERLKRSRLKPEEGQTYPWKNALKKQSIPLLGVKARVVLSGVAALLCFIFWSGWMANSPISFGFEGNGGKLSRGKVASLQKLPAKAYHLKPIEKFKPQLAEEIHAEVSVPKVLKSSKSGYPKTKKDLTLIPTKKIVEVIEAPQDQKLVDRAKVSGLKNKVLKDLPIEQLARAKKEVQAENDKSLVKRLAIKVFNLKKAERSKHSSLYTFNFEGNKVSVEGKISLD